MGLIYTQPQGFAQIDWGNPITRGILGEINAASPGIGAAYVGGANSTVVTPMGLAHAGNGSRFIWKGSQPIGSAATILLISNVRNKFDGTNIFGGIGTTTAGNQLFAFQGPASGASFRAIIRLADGGGYTSRESASIPSNSADITDLSVWCAVYNGTTNLRLYRNGVDDSGTSTNTGASGAATGLNCFSLGGINRGTDSFAMSGQNQALIVPWNRALSVDEAKSITANPWQIFKSQSRRIWVAAAGGGDATATITGVSGSAQVGTVSTSGNASVSLPGASGAGSVGNVVASVSAATAITGVNGAGQVGNTTQTGAANVAVSTVAGTGQVGTVSASGIGAPDGNVAITGIAGTGQVGTLAASGNGAVSITGIAATGSVGSVTPSVTVTTTITGAIGTGSVGTTTQTGAANATVSSAVGIGLVGTVSATGTSQDGNAVISGISGIGGVGIVSANDGTVVNNHGFIIIDTEPRLWWKRKPSKLDDKKAEEKIFKVARVIERVVKHVANSNEPSVSKEVYRKAAYAEVAPLLREMPGFDWSPMFRAILTQSKLQEQNRIAAEQAGILAKQEIERIKRIRDDEEALIVLLMGA